MSVGLYMDHHVHREITAALRRRGVDVLTSAEDDTAIECSTCRSDISEA